MDDPYQNLSHYPVPDTCLFSTFPCFLTRCNFWKLKLVIYLPMMCCVFNSLGWRTLFFLHLQPQMQSCNQTTSYDPSNTSRRDFKCIYDWTSINLQLNKIKFVGQPPVFGLPGSVLTTLTELEPFLAFFGLHAIVIGSTERMTSRTDRLTWALPCSIIWQ